jgi:hypothetical protein
MELKELPNICHGLFQSKLITTHSPYYKHHLHETTCHAWQLIPQPESWPEAWANLLSKMCVYETYRIFT